VQVGAKRGGKFRKKLERKGGVREKKSLGGGAKWKKGDSGKTMSTERGDEASPKEGDATIERSCETKTKKGKQGFPTPGGGVL